MRFEPRLLVDVSTPGKLLANLVMFAIWLALVVLVYRRRSSVWLALVAALPTVVLDGVFIPILTALIAWFLIGQRPDEANTRFRAPTGESLSRSPQNPGRRRWWSSP